MNYYQVKAICGHVKRNNYILKTFYIKAEDGKEAAAIARKTPRVKHDKKYAIQSVKKITKEEYLLGQKANKEDPYLKVTSVQEQRVMCPNLYEETIREEEEISYKKTHIRRNLVEGERRKEWRNQKNYRIE